MWQLLIPTVASLLDKLIPDPQASADAKLKMMEMAQNGELAVLAAETEMAKGQMAINQEEAKQDMFRGGWRPAAGWVCSIGLAYTFLIQPLLAWYALSKGWPLPPSIDMDTLMGLLMGMLGLGGFRTFERVKGKIK